MNRAKKRAGPEAAPRDLSRCFFWNKLLLFCGLSVYVELALHWFLFHAVDSHIVYPALFGAMLGTLTALLVSPLPKHPQRIAAVLLVLAQCILAEIQLIYHAVFGNLMPISQLQMGGGVITEFFDQTVYAMGRNALRVVALLLPLPVLLVLMLRKRLRIRLPLRKVLPALGGLLLLAALTVGCMRFVCWHSVRAWEQFTDSKTSSDLSYRHFGMSATTLQETRYMLLGGGAQAEGVPLRVREGMELRYDPDKWNVVPEIRFTELAASTEDPELRELDEFFAGSVPTRKNEYTGLLKGFNVIELCAESYSPAFVSEELTPTLWKMSHSGIVFENYYGTFNSVTTNGEYTMCLGLLPDMTRSKQQSSFDKSVGHYLPFCLGMILKDYGYTTWAYHSNNGEFYNRTLTHPNMGYTFHAQGSGLNVTPLRPASDLEMIENSVDEYLRTGGPFHAYYMTYSGHYQYDWKNAMSAKNRDKVQDLPYSEEVKAYIACNLELESAMSRLLELLEQAGQLNNTVIVLTNDHYPYGLSREQYDELCGHPVDVEFEKYRNHFICYAPGLEQTIRTDRYCSTVDILPTLLNLLGIEYDSRLLAGTDVFAEGFHAAILQDGSFVTERFRCNEAYGTTSFTDPEAEITEEQLAEYRAWVQEKFSVSRRILNSDYYAHVFPGRFRPDQLESLPFDDDLNVESQSYILFLYRKGLVDAYAERSFGPKEDALLGDWATAIYRYLDSPAFSEAALPEQYPAEEAGAMEAFRNDPRYAGVCWAFEKGLLRPEDRLTDYRSPIDNVEICLLLYRTLELLGQGDLRFDRSKLDDFHPNNPQITEPEREAVCWALERGMIRGDGASMSTMFDDLPENRVNRYRMVLFLIKILYPDIVF